MKAVIVFDVDENKIGNEVNSISIGDTILYIDKKIRVKPLPQKKSHKECSWNAEEIETTNDYEDGYNACREEISGETE